MWKNSLKTLLLMSTLAGIMMLLGQLMGSSSGLTIAFVIALIFNGIMYFFSDKIVLSLYGAQPLNTSEYPAIEPMVRELCTKMNMPMPKLWIVKTNVANAFATGRNPENGSVAFTTKILELLEPHELRGVVAHELSHIYNRDILVTTIAATMAATIGYLCNFLQHAVFYRAVSGNSRDTKNGGSMIGMIVVAVLMPIIALLIRLGISRSREYLADESGAAISQDPLALADALKKLHQSTDRASFSQDDTVAQATSGLFIVNPFNSMELSELLSTHPPVAKRISLLQKMYTQQRPGHR